MGSCECAVNQKANTNENSYRTRWACNTLALNNSSLMADIAQKLSPHGSTLIRQHRVTNIQKTDALVRSIVSTIETPTNGVKHYGAGLIREHLSNCVHSEKLTRHLIWHFEVVNNRPFIPICLYQRLILGRSGIFRLHHVWWTRRISNFVTYLHEPASKQCFHPNVSYLYPRNAPL